MKRANYNDITFSQHKQHSELTNAFIKWILFFNLTFFYFKKLVYFKQIIMKKRESERRE